MPIQKIARLNTRQPLVPAREARGLNGLRLLVNFSTPSPREQITGTVVGSTPSEAYVGPSGVGEVVGAGGWIEPGGAWFDGSTGEMTLIAVVRSASPHGSAVWPVISCKTTAGFNEHYPYDNGLMYMGTFHSSRWCEAVSPQVDIYSPHTVVVTSKVGQQRFFQNGLLAGSAALSEGPSPGHFIFGSNGVIYSLAVFDRVISDSEIARYSKCPWELFSRRSKYQFFVPTAASGLPTLSAPTYVPGSLLTTGWRPRFTATY